jgi:hypothetical protein
MNISEYRVQFASFKSSLELARYEHHVGQTSALNNDEIYDRYSDLFSPTTIADLQSLRDHTATDFDTERSGLQRLLTTAQLQQIELQASEITSELAYCESSQRIEWRGERISLEGVLLLLAREANKTIRGELAARWADSISICDELRIARVDSFRASAHILGFGSYWELIAKAANSEVEGAESTARALLEQTQSEYSSALSEMNRDYPEQRLGDLDCADLPYFAAMPWLDKFFLQKDAFRIHEETLRGLGIRLDKQPNLKINTAGKSAACFPINPPEDVRFAVPQRDGAFLDFLQQAGKAQQHAWSSKNLSQTRPEFVYSPDTATTEGYGYLFGYLLLDPRWLLEFAPDINSARASEIARDLALHLALHLRQLCADILYGAMLHGPASRSREQLQLVYVDLYQQATSFRTRPELFLLNLQERLAATSRLRALAFSFGLREYLRVRYGHRWWASRKAGDDLIDLWNTASRFSVEELARQIGFGELSYDLLAEVTTTAIRGV